MGSVESGYQLGSNVAELERLDLQGRVLAPACPMSSRPPRPSSLIRC